MDQYFLLASDGFSYERMPADRTLEAALAEIRHGEHDDVDRVIRVNLVTGQCADVTKEIAGILRDEINQHNDKPHRALRDFIEWNCGASALHRGLEAAE